MKRHNQELAVTVAWTLVLLNMVMISPVSWKPYVAIIAPVYPALLLMRRHLLPGWRLLLPLGYILGDCPRPCLLAALPSDLCAYLCDVVRLPGLVAVRHAPGLAATRRRG